MKGNETFNLDPSGLQQELTKMLNKLNLVEHACVASVFENEVKNIHHNGKEDTKYSGYSLIKPREENPTNITHITIIRALTHLGYSNINNTWTTERDISPLISAFRFGLPPLILGPWFGGVRHYAKSLRDIGLVG